MSFQMTGVAEMDRKLANIARAVPGGAGASLYRRAESILTASADLVPVDLGNLKASGFVDQPQRTGTRIEVRLGYGGAAAPYAAVVHYDLSAKHPNGGQALYLEEPFLAATATMGQDIADDLRDAAAGAV